MSKTNEYLQVELFKECCHGELNMVSIHESQEEHYLYCECGEKSLGFSVCDDYPYNSRVEEQLIFVLKKAPEICSRVFSGGRDFSTPTDYCALEDKMRELKLIYPFDVWLIENKGVTFTFVMATEDRNQRAELIAEFLRSR